MLYLDEAIFGCLKIVQLLAFLDVFSLHLFGGLLLNKKISLSFSLCLLFLFELLHLSVQLLDIVLVDLFGFPSSLLLFLQLAPFKAQLSPHSLHPYFRWQVLQDSVLHLNSVPHMQDAHRGAFDLVFSNSNIGLDFLVAHLCFFPPLFKCLDRLLFTWTRCWWRTGNDWLGRVSIHHITFNQGWKRSLCTFAFVWMLDLDRLILDSFEIRVLFNYIFPVYPDWLDRVFAPSESASFRLFDILAMSLQLVYPHCFATVIAEDHSVAIGSI